MKRLAYAFLTLAVLSLGLVIRADAATLSKQSYTTARKAAVAGALYHWNKAAGYGKYRSGSAKVTQVIDDQGRDQKFRVETKALKANGRPEKSKTSSVRKDGSRSFRVFLPNRYTYTPPGAGN